MENTNISNPLIPPSTQTETISITNMNESIEERLFRAINEEDDLHIKEILKGVNISNPSSILPIWEYKYESNTILHKLAFVTITHDEHNSVFMKEAINLIFEYLDNDEVYFMFRIPHKSITEVFRQRTKMGSFLTRIRDMIMSPIVSESYGYSVRINEARLLPKEINCVGAFHRQKLKKAVVTVSIADNYEINDASCYKIRRLEDELYKNFLPKDFDDKNIVTYQWQQSREINLKGHFNFYLNISHSSISPGSVLIYILIIVLLNAAGSGVWDMIKTVCAFLTQ
jgi:hypothetical protein